MTHPDTYPDSPQKSGTPEQDLRRKIHIRMLHKGGLGGYKIRRWIDGKRKEAYRKHNKCAPALQYDPSSNAIQYRGSLFRPSLLQELFWWGPDLSPYSLRSESSIRRPDPKLSPLK